MTAKLQVFLFADRTIPGMLVVEFDGRTVFVCPCKGHADDAAAKEHGNPTRSPVLPYGDTPTGLYKVINIGSQTPESSYGPGPVFSLTPVSGQCQQAATNGRSGIWIHGGDIAWYGLRWTDGCIRIPNEAQKPLAALIAFAATPVYLTVIEVPATGGKI